MRSGLEVEGCGLGGRVKRLVWRVYGSRFGVFELRVQDSVFGFWGLGLRLRVQGSGFRLRVESMV